MRGDRLLSVGGRPVAQLGAAKVQELLAGEEGGFPSLVCSLLLLLHLSRN